MPGRCELRATAIPTLSGRMVDFFGGLGGVGAGGGGFFTAGGFLSSLSLSPNLEISSGTFTETSGFLLEMRSASWTPVVVSSSLIFYG